MNVELGINLDSFNLTTKNYNNVLKGDRELLAYNVLLFLTSLV
jgi:hypothetical protein